MTILVFLAIFLLILEPDTFFPLLLHLLFLAAVAFLTVIALRTA